MTDGLADRIDRLRDRIARAGRDPQTVTVVAVTKGFAIETVQQALASGLTDLGENYAQDLSAKAGALDAAQRAAVRWHFIGRLQTNKVRLIAPEVALWQSVDRPAVAEQIAKHAPHAEVLVQVNTSGEEQKGGCTPDDTGRLVARCRELGLTCVGSCASDPQRRPTSRAARSVVSPRSPTISICTSARWACPMISTSRSGKAPR